MEHLHIYQSAELSVRFINASVSILDYLVLEPQIVVRTEKSTIQKLRQC